MRLLFFLAAASLLLTLAVYEVCVRRWNVTRFLFGMKPKPARTTPQSADSPPSPTGVPGPSPG